MKIFFKIAYTTNNKQLLLMANYNNSQNSSNKHKESGIYLLKFGNNDCNDFYIGTTTINFNARYKQFMRSWENDHGRSIYAVHVRLKGHKFIEYNNLVILEKLKNKNKNSNNKSIIKKSIANL